MKVFVSICRSFAKELLITHVNQECIYKTKSKFSCDQDTKELVEICKKDLNFGASADRVRREHLSLVTKG